MVSTRQVDLWPKQQCVDGSGGSLSSRTLFKRNRVGLSPKGAASARRNMLRLLESGGE